ncbi:hypothetical protein M3Y99_01014100 [Aphelenchoides fujianensis]|nr:hypothetical protein M3Y99_01014100 [Aphelenchoides fujianensis]
MRVLLALSLFGVLLLSADALECYTGWAIIRGRSMTHDVNTLIKGKMAGCSTFRCALTRNTCTGQGHMGSRSEICCCNTDRCNANREMSASDKIRSGLDLINAG